ncbi:N-terminal acetyltransferase B complex catalytic subunit NAT5 [Pteropus alecto]|uniref:N-alpha-acetyltransferase 20 n=1 Tax=Pteropus alecto TaxID=9402 RepID=L5K0C9_PTEAL|nr:N-terminal acetyltransferase B complex catalytic subunit NAT5 [Pteropus alecto]
MTTLRAFTCDDLFRFNNMRLAGEQWFLEWFLTTEEHFENANSGCLRTTALELELSNTELCGMRESAEQCLPITPYLAHWPEYFIVAEAPGGELMGYIMGKAEGSVAREEWHGHVTALSVAPEFRRLGLAAKLMELLEEISERKGGFFVDLFVRVSNQVAVNMYKQLGYSVYRTVIEYYSASNGEPDEDAYGQLPSVAESPRRS